MIIQFYTFNSPALLLKQAGYIKYKNLEGFIKPDTNNPKGNRFHCFAYSLKPDSTRPSNFKFRIDLHYDKIKFINERPFHDAHSKTVGFLNKEVERILNFDRNSSKIEIKLKQRNWKFIFRRIWRFLITSVDL